MYLSKDTKWALLCCFIFYLVCGPLFGAAITFKEDPPKDIVHTVVAHEKTVDQSGNLNFFIYTAENKVVKVNYKQYKTPVNSCVSVKEDKLHPMAIFLFANVAAAFFSFILFCLLD